MLSSSLSGIAGVVYPDLFHAQTLIEPMIDSLKHRSLRGTEFHTFRNVQLGICGQPLATNQRKTLVVGLDGALYHCENVKKELHQHGYQRSLESCSEIILAAYEIWGIDSLDKFSGDFALFIFDQEEKKLILARDRVGKKPLYWYHDNGVFLFGSELKSLLATGAIPQCAANDALAAYLFFGYVPQDMTPMKGINKLLPSFYLEIHMDQTKNILPYWSYSSYFGTHLSTHRQTIVKELDHLLDESVHSRLAKGGATGCIVLGGIGSASIAHYVSKHRDPTNIHGYSTCFAEENEEDLAAAVEAMDALLIKQTMAKITPETLLDDIVRICWHLDEPIADPNIVATWQQARLSSALSDTVFSGMGSDETLAGHSRYQIEEQEVGFLERIKRNTLPTVSHLLAQLLHTLHSSYSFQLMKMGKTNLWRHSYLEQNALFTAKELRKVSPRLAKLFDTETFLSKFYHLPRERSNVASFLYFDVKTRLADCYIHQYERLTAAHQLQWRAPFLDRRLMEYLAGLADHILGEQQEPARFLKALLKEVFPAHFLNRPKVNRPDFLKKWVTHPSINEVFQLLTKGTLVESHLISRDWLQSLLQNHHRKGNAFRSLWSVLMLEIWFRLFINRPIQTEAPHMSIRELLQ